MIIVDVNLLLYAVISGFPQHQTARTWWEGLLNSPMEVGLTSPAIFGFLRIATNPRVLESPLPVEAASRYLREWLERPNVQFVTPGPRDPPSRPFASKKKKKNRPDLSREAIPR